jgi:hypothetical protein
MEATTPPEAIAELRNAIALTYEDVRGLVVRLPLEEGAHPTAVGRDVRNAIAQLVLGAIGDARVGRRLAAGHAAASLGPGRMLDLISDWRLRRALLRATKRDLLAAWESAFNELFSSLNDAAEPAVDSEDLATARARAIAFLGGAADRIGDRLAEIQRAAEVR